MSNPFIKSVNKTLASFFGVLAISCLVALPAFSQQNPINSANRVNTSRSGTNQNGRLIGGNDTYPRGSRISSNGIISNLRGQRTIPSVSIKHGDGSTSYYYRNGSRITIDTAVPPTGTLIR